MPRPEARATLLLFAGGSGSIGLQDGVPGSQNFLVRSRELFAQAGFNVFLIGRPSDRPDLDNGFRASPPHLADIRAVVGWLKQQSNVPIWLVGTSRGTISAAAGAIDLQDAIAGVVLTSSITSFKLRGVPTLALENIRVPVLLVHHADDACKACSPNEVRWISEHLSNAPIKHTRFMNGGTETEGDPCGALHRHGYIGIEAETVRVITDWIKAPRSTP
jgi:pimeloyl-ACP methyl ester carboxylesterase